MKAGKTSARGNMPDIAFGGSLVTIFAIVMWETRNLKIGTMAEMGAGFMPKVLATMLGVSGLILLIKGLLAAKASIPVTNIKSSGFMIASIAVFAFTLLPCGVVIATFIMTIFATLAGSDHRWKEMVIFSLLLSALTVLVFVTGLKLPLPIWPAFLG